MALRWMEGFENCRNAVLFQRKYTAASVVGIGAVDVGWQGKGFCINESCAGGGLDVVTPVLVGAVENSWIMGWAWRLEDPAGLSGSQTTFPSLVLHNSVGQQLQFEMLAFNETKPGGVYWRLQVRRGSTVLATSTKIFEFSTWYYIEVKATIHPSTGSFEMRWWGVHSTSATVDTFNGATLTGINTASQGTAGADRLRILLSSAPLTGGSDEVMMDDLYVLDSTGGSMNNYLGKQIIEAMIPNANGNSIQWDLAGGAASVADAWGEPGDTQGTAEDDKRLTSDTLNEIELADYAPLANIRLVGVRGILLHTNHKMDTSGNRNLHPRLRKTTGTPAEVSGTTINVSSTNYTGSSELFALDPNTAAAWVIADLNAYQFGMQTGT